MNSIHEVCLTINDQRLTINDESYPHTHTLIYDLVVCIRGLTFGVWPQQYPILQFVLCKS